MQMRALLLCGTLGLSVMLAACDSDSSDEDAAVEERPTSFERFNGVLPCQDCDGIKTDLTLKLDQYGKPNGYVMSETYQGDTAGARISNRSGHWALLEHKGEGSVYQLDPEDKDACNNFQRVDEKTLRKLDCERQPIKSDGSYDLTRVAESR